MERILGSLLDGMHPSPVETALASLSDKIPNNSIIPPCSMGDSTILTPGRGRDTFSLPSRRLFGVTLYPSPPRGERGPTLCASEGHTTSSGHAENCRFYSEGQH